MKKTIITIALASLTAITMTGCIAASSTGKGTYFDITDQKGKMAKDLDYWADRCLVHYAQANCYNVSEDTFIRMWEKPADQRWARDVLFANEPWIKERITEIRNRSRAMLDEDNKRKAQGTATTDSVALNNLGKKLDKEKELAAEKERVMKKIKELEECSKSIACMQTYEANKEGTAKGRTKFYEMQQDAKERLDELNKRK